jgi:glyoxylase-like metal-dependent hydrolase (beta-lactamase superfamily II)
MEEVHEGIRRVTLPLPTRPGHVHAYLLEGAEGWTLVDTGMGLPDARERWAGELAGLPGPVVRVFVTHFHPDHVGAARDLVALTGAAVLQGRLDYAQCDLVWGNPRWGERLAEWFARHGVPPHVTRELVDEGAHYAKLVRYQPDPELLGAGESLDGWELVAAPGHADGQLCLLRDGVLVSADHLLLRITPTVGLWPASRPDPLGDYLEALERTIELAPRLALPGHGESIDDPVGRARELIEHHRLRLEATRAALSAKPQSGYELSFPLFGDDLRPAARRFAVAETLSHVERLVREGGARRDENVEGVTYTAA